MNPYNDMYQWFRIRVEWGIYIAHSYDVNHRVSGASLEDIKQKIDLFFKR